MLANRKEVLMGTRGTSVIAGTAHLFVITWHSCFSQDDWSLRFRSTIEETCKMNMAYLCPCARNRQKTGEPQRCVPLMSQLIMSHLGGGGATSCPGRLESGCMLTQCNVIPWLIVPWKLTKLQWKWDWFQQEILRKNAGCSWDKAGLDWGWVYLWLDIWLHILFLVAVFSKTSSSFVFSFAVQSAQFCPSCTSLNSKLEKHLIGRICIF